MGYNKDIPIATFRNVDDAEVVCSWLNELYDENEQLRQQLNECHKKWNNSMDIARINQNSTRELLDENRELRHELQKKQEEERLYANEIVKLNKEVKDNQFLRLGNDY